MLVSLIFRFVGRSSYECLYLSVRRFASKTITQSENIFGGLNSGRGLPQSKTLRDHPGRGPVRQVLDCASLLARSQAHEVGDGEISPSASSRSGAGYRTPRRFATTAVPPEARVPADTRVLPPGRAAPAHTGDDDSCVAASGQEICGVLPGLKAGGA